MIGSRPNNLYEKTYAFGVRVVRTYQHISQEKREYVLSKQLLRCGTSIGPALEPTSQKLMEPFQMQISPPRFQLLTKNVLRKNIGSTSSVIQTISPHLLSIVFLQTLMN